MNNIKHLNNYSIAEKIFNNTLEWAANKTPSKNKEQLCADIEKVLDLVEDRDGFYKRGYERGYLDHANEERPDTCNSKWDN